VTEVLQRVSTEIMVRTRMAYGCCNDAYCFLSLRAAFLGDPSTTAISMWSGSGPASDGRVPPARRWQLGHLSHVAMAMGRDVSATSIGTASLVATPMYVELVLLRLVHVLRGISWAGSALFLTVFLGPALAASGPNAGPVMHALKARRLVAFMPAVALLTIASGLRLMWITSGGFAMSYFTTPHGLAFAIAGGAAIVGFAFAMIVLRPAQERLARLAPAMAQAEGEQRAALSRELDIVRRRNALASALSLALLLLGAGGMALARYLG
jgi:uncharacterized membrane protein